ncbi:NADP-dependent 3-hydroxy acid dehydrogenase YdfG [Murinocardiopsis flavida]|uniref:NADP-dependent 3-hydroxy acid dehydrogenase YdfG n=1 Tax=Murinocardiopsis flavida TaxID=645275 RepID=A0A2P8DUP1_9ACTN|nr:SDR family NAD(P)-dependent oxidoreductase [Murinocardiopsis flavida]PSL00925.1 NADP-dependent 3-hydroxy acid dehydrogenase YdfG [Murinocardiopsis flavida]
MGKTAVVTGASSGIGAACARGLAAAGYEVVLLARRAERLDALAAELGGRAFPVDITDRAAVDAAVGGLERCDVLVNNAGGALGTETVAAGDPADWARMYEVNVLGSMHVTQALLPLLRAPRDECGTIVTITSTAALGVYEGGGGYTAAKHAERAFTETLRLELCGEPVRVIDIAPGMVHTGEFALNRYRGDADRADAVYADVDRPLTPEDVAGCVTWVIAQPAHVNIDRLVVRPLAQAAQHRLHRGPLFAEK